ncbi:MAG: hypothetical protein KJT03_23495, partial [Verrucomicrobiae bacterium]|nr:hypothetical protein [Verrucomicrobiae bacterium]
MPGKTGITSNVGDRRGYPLINYVKPRGLVLAKTIHRDGFKVETQILHWDGYWRGYSYRWNEAQTDASLVRKEGLDTEIAGKTYHFPSRDECIRCHGSNFNRPLAFFPGQMDRDGQLSRFRKLGIIDDVFVQTASRQPLANPYDKAAPLELRARSWLHSNCSHCHKVSGGSGLTTMMNAAVPTDRMDLIGTSPSRGYFGMSNAHQIDPGNPYHSVLYYRIATKGAGHMPMVGSQTIDKQGVQLIHDWIRSLDPGRAIETAKSEPATVEEALALYHRIQSGNLSEKEAQAAIENCLQSQDAFIINLFAGFQ